MSENQNNSENTQNEKNTSVEKENRKEKLNTLRGMGINPFPNSYDVTYKSKDIAEKFEELEKNETEVAAVPESQLSAVSLTPTEAYFTISCAEIYPTTITFAGIDNYWYYSDQAKDIIAPGAQIVTNLERGIFF